MDFKNKVLQFLPEIVFISAPKHFKDYTTFIYREFEHTMLYSEIIRGSKPSMRSVKDRNKYLQNQLYPGLRLASNFISSKNKILVIDELNITYSVSPSSAKVHKPSIRSAIDKTDAYIKKAHYVHNNKFIYSKVVYKSKSSKIIISCPIHGDFKQDPNSHLQGTGCPVCANEVGGYSNTQWCEAFKRSTNKNKVPKVYIIECYNSEESFIKIGKTFQQVAERFNSSSALPYKYKILRIITGDCRSISDIERELHHKHYSKKYTPKLPFAGSTECFKFI